MRELTERPEGIEAGLAHLVGTDPNLICSKFEEVMEAGDDPPETNQSVYGDGNAASRILERLSGTWTKIVLSGARLTANFIVSHREEVGMEIVSSTLRIPPNAALPTMIFMLLPSLRVLT